MKQLTFLKNSIKNLRTMGTITPSSRFLCKAMVRHVDFERTKVLVELGAGSGVITHHILEGMDADSKLLSFEVNDLFYPMLHGIGDRRLTVVEDSAERIGHHLQQIHAAQADCIISAIPFVALPKTLAYRIITACHAHLKPGGRFIQFHYSLLAKPIYEEVFDDINVHFVPLNVPPAFVLVCTKH